MNFHCHRRFLTAMGRSAFILMLLGLTVFVCPGYKKAFSGPCDPRILDQALEGEMGYKKRGDLCEGFYRSKVSTPPIALVAAIQGQWRFKPDKEEVLIIDSPLVTDQAVQVRAVGIPLRTYYRMDGQIGPGQKLRWPLADVIWRQRLSSGKIGLYGWIGREADKTYVPLRVVPSRHSLAKDKAIRLIFRASLDVESVKWRLSGIKAGFTSRPGPWQDASRYGYRRGRPIPVLLPPGKQGVLVVDVAAKESRQGRWVKCRVRVRVGP